MTGQLDDLAQLVTLPLFERVVHHIQGYNDTLTVLLGVFEQQSPFGLIEARDNPLLVLEWLGEFLPELVDLELVDQHHDPGIE